VTPATPTPSYRALLGVPMLPRVLLGMQIARIAQSMIGVAIVLFTLQQYDSPALTGLVTFVAIFPGLLISPIAGALLDRHGRARLVVLDYIVALASMFAIGLLALAGMLPAWLLLLISLVSSFTSPLSNTGLRTLLPAMVPSHLWERVNAVDSNGYVVATIIGPPVAAAMVQIVGGPQTIIAIGLLFGVAAIVLVRIRDPHMETATTGHLLRDAWLGVVYTWRNLTLRGLGFSISAVNLAGGMMTIVLPLIILGRLGESEAMVGVMFALLGIGGMVTAFAFGRMDTRGREKGLIAVPMLLMAPATALLIPDAGLLPIAVSMVAIGVLNGPLDIGMFTIRQRRTDPAWMGRAFAVSMSFNFAGYPIGASLAGWIASVSVDAAVVLGVVACVAAAIIAWAMIPARDEDAERRAAAAAAAGGAGVLPARAEVLAAEAIASAGAWDTPGAEPMAPLPGMSDGAGAPDEAPVRQRAAPGDEV
jgi:MFS family permease